MNRIDKKFKELAAINKKAFVAFITAGYPDLALTEELAVKLEKSGVDILELGVPFSDPMADGAIIQEASKVALDKNTHLIDILKTVKKIRNSSPIPICLMTYYNPIFCFGEENFVRQACDAGVDGVIIPDLPPEEARSFIRYSSKFGLDTVFFLAPTSTKKRIELVSRVSRGFIYYVSLTGVTGPRQSLPADFAKQINLIKDVTKKPVCVGFGVSTPGQVKEVNKFADGVIVGSAIVKTIKDNIGKPDLVEKVCDFVRFLIGKA